MQMGSAVTNNLAELDHRRAANENSRLELTRINLELTKTQLELYLSRDSQLIANTAAESQRLTYNNQRLLASCPTRLPHSVFCARQAWKRQSRTAYVLL